MRGWTDRHLYVLLLCWEKMAGENRKGDDEVRKQASKLCWKQGGETDGQTDEGDGVDSAYSRPHNQEGGWMRTIILVRTDEFWVRYGYVFNL